MSDILRKYFNLKIIAAAVTVAVILFFAVLILLWTSRPTQSPRTAATAILNVIPASTATQPFIATPEGVASPTPEMVPTPPPGIIAVGAYVQVSGTGGDGLRMRSEAGLQAEVRFVAIEAEVFQVVDGPRDIDNYTWWYLVAPYDQTRSGWAVSNYLAVIQNP
jgi:hypothetical protein